jgi:hypothetical protein
MPARPDRLADFETVADPPPDCLVQLLCEDHVGTFVLPFLCRTTPEGFKNDRTGERIEADVVGWREPKERSRLQGPDAGPSAPSVGHPPRPASAPDSFST